MKKRAYLFLLTSIAFLPSCAGGETPIASTIPASSEPSESSESPVDSSPNGSSSSLSSGFSISLAQSEMTAGSDFLSVCKPSYFLDGEPLDESKISKTQVIFGETKMDAAALLMEPGEYTFKARTSDLDTAYVSFTVLEADVKEASEGNGYSTVSEEESEKTSLAHIPYAGALGLGKTPSRGEVNLLVIPATFSGGLTWSETKLSALESAFKGEEGETGWESLKSFYDESSYGKLSLNPIITSPYTFSVTESEGQTNFKNKSSSVTSLAEEAFSSSLSSLGKSASDFDSDGDGFVDAVEIVYLTSKSVTSNYASDGSKFWWNFTTYDSSTSANLKTPAMRRYCWMNASSIFNGYYDTDIDPHVVTHEFGHMLGLNDYYDYDGTGAPMGLVDMMDLNIGDHNAYSKYLLGWVTPKVLDHSYSDLEITLNDFESSGDCLLIPTSADSFNDTPYAEYLMLSYYTPTGLNEQDSSGYPEWSKYGTGGSYSYRGLELIHVDERLYDRIGSKEDSISGDLAEITYNYVDDPFARTGPKLTDGVLTDDYAYQLTSNTPSESGEIVDGALKLNSSYREAKVIPASAEDIFLGSSSTVYKKLGSKDVLYGLTDYGCRYDEFTPSLMADLFPNDGAYDDGNHLNVSFKVTVQSESSITIRLALR